MSKALIHAHDETLTSQKFQKQSWTFSNNSTCLYNMPNRVAIHRFEIQSQQNISPVICTCHTFRQGRPTQSFISLQTKYVETLIPQWIFHLAQGLPTGHVMQKSQQREQH